LAGGGLAYLVKRQFTAIDATAKLSDQLGIATERLQELRHAADLSGAGAETLDAGLKTMAKRLGEAARGSGAAKPALDELGLSAQKLIAMSPDEAFVAIATALKGIEEPARRNAIAANLFSKANMGLLNTLALGREGLNEAAAEARSLGMTFSRKTAAGIETAVDAFGNMRKAIGGAVMSLTVSLAPALEQSAQFITGLVAVLRDQNSEIGQNIIRIAKWSVAITAGIVAISAISKAGILLIRIYQALATTHTILLSVAGPKGWLLLAAGLGVAAGAVYGLSKAFNSVNNSIDQACKKIRESGNATVNTTQQVTKATQAIREVSDQITPFSGPKFKVPRWLRAARRAALQQLEAAYAQFQVAKPVQWGAAPAVMRGTAEAASAVERARKAESTLGEAKRHTLLLGQIKQELAEIRRRHQEADLALADL